MKLWVLLLLLVVVEEELDRCCSVAILPGQDDLDTEVEDVLPHLLALVVGCVVEQPVGVVPPVALLVGENGGQPGEKHEHHVAVGVELREAEVEMAIGVNGCDHVDAMAEALR